MPHQVKKSGGKYVVAKKSTGKTVATSGHFPTKAGAVRQMRAMYFSEKRARRG